MMQKAASLTNSSQAGLCVARFGWALPQKSMIELGKGQYHLR